MSSANKFASIIAARKAEPDRGQAEEVLAPQPPPAQQQERSSTPLPALTQELPKRGRPAVGKRSDPSYEQVTAYVRRDTYQDIKIALLRENRKRDFSDLIEELLTHWLNSHS